MLIYGVLKNALTFTEHAQSVRKGERERERERKKSEQHEQDQQMWLENWKG